MNRPVLSIIIPVHNQEKFIRKCILSILKQLDEKTLKEVEVIIIDDCSKDKTKEICQEFVSRFETVRYFELSENKGPLYARIEGINHSEGEFFTFCDSDDEYSKGAIKTILENITDSDSDIIQFSYYKKWNHLKSKHNSSRTGDRVIYSEQFYDEEYPKLLCSFWEPSDLSNSTWNKVYHNKLRDQLNCFDYNSQLFWGDDQILNLMLLKDIKKAEYINKPIYIYNQGTGGTSKFSINTMYDLDIVKKFQLDLIKKYKHPKQNAIYRTCYSEVVGWSFCYFQKAFQILSKEKFYDLIRKSFSLSSFRETRQWYTGKNNSKWEALNLFLNSEPDEYYQYFVKNDKKDSLKVKVRRYAINLLKRV